MTSKEALERLKNNATEAGHRIAKANRLKDKDIVKAITSKGITTIIYPEEELTIIEKDLEILDILKNIFNYETVNEFLDESVTTEQFYKLQEWVKVNKNDKQM